MDEGENTVLGRIGKGLGSHQSLKLQSVRTVKEEGPCTARGVIHGEGIKESVGPALTKFGVKA